MFDNPFWAMFMGNSPQVGGWDPSMWGGGGMYPPGYNFGYPTTAPQMPAQQAQPKAPYVDPKTGYTFAEGREQGPKVSAREQKYWQREAKTNPNIWWNQQASQEWDPNFQVHYALNVQRGRDGTAQASWNQNSPWYQTHLSDQQRAWGDQKIAEFNKQFNPTGGTVNQRNVLDTIKGMTDAQRGQISPSNTYFAEALKIYNQNKDVDPSRYTFDRFGKVTSQTETPTPMAPPTPAGPTPPSLDRMKWYGQQIRQARENDNMDRVQRLKRNRAEYRTR